MQEVINHLISEAKRLEGFIKDGPNGGGFEKLERWKKRMAEYLKVNLNEEEGTRLQEVEGPVFMGDPQGNLNNECLALLKHLNALAVDLKEHPEFYEPKQQKEISQNPEIHTSKRIFVVHGQEAELKETVARLLTQLELEPIILHEQPNEGHTIIEKFEKYSGVSFAVVLLTPDDEIICNGVKKMQARQNVLLELGFFLGKLGRKKVAVLCRDHKSMELPSDYSGVLFIPLDANDAWKFTLAKEIRAAGIDVDLNRLS